MAIIIWSMISGIKMTKRTLEIMPVDRVSSSFHFIRMPIEIMCIILNPIDKLQSFFGLLFINRESYAELPHYIPAILEGDYRLSSMSFGIGRRDSRTKLHWNIVKRYIKTCVTSLSLETRKEYDLTGFSRLSHVKLGRDCVTVDMLQRLPSLRSLDLSCMGTYDKNNYSEIYRLTSLVTLNLGGNYSNVGNHCLRRMTSLTNLNISYNNDLIDGIGSLVNLQSLNIVHGHTRIVGSVFCRLTSLHTLFIDFSQCDAYSIVCIPNLIRLVIICGHDSGIHHRARTYIKEHESMQNLVVEFK